MRFIHSNTRGRFSAISLFFAAAALASVLAIALAQFNTTGAQTGDYDADDDGLIEINSVAQLNAVRWDLNGDGAADRAANVQAYRAAFPNAQARLGCPSSGCSGYELMRDLTSSSFNYWTPIGDNSRRFSATFKGNGHSISNLGFNSAADPMGLFGGSSGAISGVGLKNVRINVSTAAEYVDLGPLVGDNIGSVSDSYATGSISATLGTASMIGGLIGYNRGNVSSVYSNVSISVAVSTASADGPRIYLGGIIGNNRGSVTSAYSKGSIRGGGNAGSAIAGLIGTNAGTLTASYSASPVSASAASTRTGGLIGSGHSTDSTIRASYWDTQASGQSASVGGGIGKTTAELQSPTANSGIYSTWPSARWDFGASNQYPVLKVDFNGDGRATWQEFGSQRANTPPARPTATATSAPTATRTPEPTATLTPTPEPTATHTPSATPETDIDTTPTRPAAAGCVAALSGASVSAKWSSACLAANTPEGAQTGKRYAGFYTFALNAPADVTVTLTSPDVADTYLYLLEGAGKDGSVMYRNNDISAENRHSRISQRLQAGNYTIEATTYQIEVAGSFTLEMTATPLPGAAPVAATPTPTATQVTAAPTPTLTPTQVTRRTDPPTSSDIPPAVQQKITQLEAVIETLRGIINELRDDMETTTAAFESRIAALEGASPAATSTPTFTPTATATTAPVARVTDPTATPTTVPTAASTPVSASPTATPTPDACIQRIVGIGWITGSWSSACASERKPNDANAPAGTRYARFYTFTLDAPANVTVSLASQSVSNTYLYLLSGPGRNGNALHENDDVDAENGNYASRIRAQLPAGSYTIEATAYNLKTAGDFTLSVDMSTR